jgi:nicotinamide-nucleotide amidase
MNLAVLTIGDEICLGHIVNTNAAWIADQCSRQGWRVLAHSAVGDAVQTIIAECERLSSLADVVIITGGLGPTHDDCTKTALAAWTDDVLVEHQPTLEHLHHLMRQRGRELNERTAAQAMQLSRCTPLQNDKGTAPGIWLEVEHTGKRTAIVALPGVPQEMRHLMADRALPRLREYAVQNASRFSQERVMLYTTLLTVGIVESALADLVGDVQTLMEGQELAFLPSAAGVKLRITVTAPTRSEAQTTLERLAAKLRSIVEPYLYGTNDDALEVIVGRLLRERRRTLAVAESCTGGLLGARLTDVEGSSAYFLGGVQCYSNEAKTRFVGVRPETLAQHGAVSEQTALELASGIRTRFDADYGIAITGIAGPGGGTPEKPVGTVWIGLADAHNTRAEGFIFSNDRTFNRERAVVMALVRLWQRLQADV